MSNEEPNIAEESIVKKYLDSKCNICVFREDLDGQPRCLERLLRNRHFVTTDSAPVIDHSVIFYCAQNTAFLRVFPIRNHEDCFCAE